MGAGHVIVLGTMPSAEQFVNLVETLAAEGGVVPVASASPNLLYVPRHGNNLYGAILVELDCTLASCELPEPALNLLTGERVADTIQISPYGVAVLQYS